MPWIDWFRKSRRNISPPAGDAIPSEQTAWLRSTLEILPKPFFLIDRKLKKVTFTNIAARRMMGMLYEENPAAKSYGEGFRVTRPDGTLMPLEQLPTQRVIRGEHVHGEQMILDSPAGQFYIKVFSEDLPKTSEHPASALIFFQDITELKKTESQLRSVQTDLNEAVEIAQVGFWSLDIETQKISVSPQLIKQFGLRADRFQETLAEAVEAMHVDDRQRVSDAINQSIVNNIPYHIEYRVVHPDGSIRWIEAKSGKRSDTSAKMKRFTGTTLDITERVRSRESLEANERDLRTLADSMPQIVWSAQPSGELDYFNQVWFDYSGSTFEENLGSGWTKFVHAEDLRPTSERWQKSLATREIYENEFRLRGKDGTYRWHVARARPIFDQNKNVIKWYGTNTDIHDQKLLADNLNEARLHADRANSAKSQFLANMSHEIRTPLGAIMGFSELMRDPGLGRNEREEFVSVIERNSTQLLRIIDDILDLSKVEAGMMLIEHIDFSLPEVLTDFSSLMGFKAREKGVAFSSRAVTAIPAMINSDPTRLRQILMNVVGNAIKFTDQGRVELRVRYENGILEFEVEDTGRGISAEQERNLFQPFTQADASTTRKYGGTGLGLVLTRSLAEALGGHFELKQSALGGGSTFSVQVRAEVAANSKFVSGLGFESAPARTIANLGMLGDMRILLVEDSPDNQALISIYLGRVGARVDIASDGEQGSKMAMAGDYDVVLMDVQMPIMDGITAIKKLRADNYTKPVIALTAHAMKEERVRCLAAGFNDFLSKPVNREELIQTLSNHRPQTARPN